LLQGRFLHVWSFVWIQVPQLLALHGLTWVFHLSSPTLLQQSSLTERAFGIPSMLHSFYAKHPTSTLGSPLTSEGKASLVLTRRLDPLWCWWWHCWFRPTTSKSRPSWV